MNTPGLYFFQDGSASVVSDIDLTTKEYTVEAIDIDRLLTTIAGGISVLGTIRLYTEVDIDWKPAYLANVNIRHLILAGSGMIENLQSLSPRITRLSIIDKPLTRIPIIPTVSTLALINTDIDTLEGVQEMDQLTALSVIDANVQSLEISRPSNLRSLEVTNNHLTNIDGLESYPNLQRLKVSDNQITTLRSGSSLQYLFADNNRLSTLKGIEGMINLTTLSVDGNLLTQLDGRSDSLSVLYVNDNQLTTLDGLLYTQELTELYADNNQIEAISTLSGNRLLMLQEILRTLSMDLTGNRLYDLSVYEGMAIGGHDLRLLLDDNLITDLDRVLTNDNCLELNVWGNPIYSPFKVNTSSDSVTQMTIDLIGDVTEDSIKGVYGDQGTWTVYTMVDRDDREYLDMTYRREDD